MRGQLASLGHHAMPRKGTHHPAIVDPAISL
jgi:hypothetical protein